MVLGIKRGCSRGAASAPYNQVISPASSSLFLIVALHLPLIFLMSFLEGTSHVIPSGGAHLYQRKCKGQHDDHVLRRPKAVWSREESVWELERSSHVSLQSCGKAVRSRESAQFCLDLERILGQHDGNR